MDGLSSKLGGPSGPVVRRILDDLPVSCVAGAGNRRQATVRLMRLLTDLVVHRLTFQHRFFFYRVRPVILLLMGSRYAGVLRLFLVGVLVGVFLAGGNSSVLCHRPRRVVLRVFCSAGRSSA